MKTIYKYPFSVADEFGLTLPIGARVLCVQTQNDLPCLWAIVDPEAKTEYSGFVNGPDLRSAFRDAMKGSL